MQITSSTRPSGSGPVRIEDHPALIESLSDMLREWVDGRVDQDVEQSDRILARIRPRFDAVDDRETELRAATPRLRAFALSLCSNRDQADDLVQETLLRAWSHLHAFEPGTNMTAWLFTILRNVFYSSYRKSSRAPTISNAHLGAERVTAPPQTAHMNLVALKEAILNLPLDYQKALMLIGAAGLSYEEATALCGCSVGTLKCRVHRARNQLVLALDMGPMGTGDEAWTGVLSQLTYQTYDG